jgi:hypothetical protein
MEDAINFAIWLRYNTTSDIYGAYTLRDIETLCISVVTSYNLKNHGDLFYIDSKSDMEFLYNIYLECESV